MVQEALVEVDAQPPQHDAEAAHHLHDEEVCEQIVVLAERDLLGVVHPAQDDADDEQEEADQDLAPPRSSARGDGGGGCQNDVHGMCSNAADESLSFLFYH